MTVDVSSTSHQTRALKKEASPQEVNLDPLEEQRQEEIVNDETLPIDPVLHDAAAVRNEESTTISSSLSDPRDRIQVLDLHTENPLISYNNRIYSCTWGSTLGTDIFLASPASTSAISKGTGITPLMSLPGVSVLGTSCINVTARPVTITPKADNPHPQQPHHAPTSGAQEHPVPATTPNTNPSPIEHPPSPKPNPFKIPLLDSAPNSRRKQASFLESLMKIKAAKNESDRVTVHATKAYQGYGWRKQQRLAELAEALDNTGNGNDSSNMDDTLDASAGATEPLYSFIADQTVNRSPAKRARTSGRGRGSPGTRRVGRPRGSRARGRVRTGDLFRDHAPGTGDGADANVGGADRTPARWADAEPRVVEAAAGENGGRVDDGDIGADFGASGDGGEAEGQRTAGQEGDVVMGEAE